MAKVEIREHLRKSGAQGGNRKRDTAMIDDANLKMPVDQTGDNSVSDDLQNASKPPANGKGTENRADEKAPDIRHAPDDRFKKAHAKTTALHAGLFRRLAK